MDRTDLDCIIDRTDGHVSASYDRVIARTSPDEDDFAQAQSKYTGLWLMARQRPEGGFPVDDQTTLFFGFYREEFDDIASSIPVPVGVDAAMLLMTALSVGFFFCRYQADKSVWEPLLYQSIGWLREVLDSLGTDERTAALDALYKILEEVEDSWRSEEGDAIRN